MTKGEEQVQAASVSPNGERKPDEEREPAELAADIERTRDDLAETLDAIAEKVSPKRVASRVGHQVTDSVKELPRNPKALADKRVLGVGVGAFLLALLALRRRHRNHDDD